MFLPLMLLPRKQLIMIAEAATETEKIQVLAHAKLYTVQK